MSASHHRRSVTLYRIAAILPLVALVYLLASGRLVTFVHTFHPPRSISEEEFGSLFTTAAVWIACLAPLLFLSWEIGNQHTSARRLGYQFFIGGREVYRAAWTGQAPGEAPPSYALPPKDRPGVALALGLATALFLPVFFAGFMPNLRSTRGLTWLGVAGTIMGLGVYSHRRAVAYLIDEPTGGSAFRQWRELKPDRYAEAGRRFVWLRIAVTIALPIWWLGGAMLLLFPQ